MNSNGMRGGWVAHPDWDQNDYEEEVARQTREQFISWAMGEFNAAINLLLGWEDPHRRLEGLSRLQEATSRCIQKAFEMARQ